MDLDILQRITAQASPALTAIINQYLPDTHNLQDYVGLTFDEWAATLGVLPPAQSQVFLPLVVQQLDRRHDNEKTMDDLDADGDNGRYPSTPLCPNQSRSHRRNLLRLRLRHQRRWGLRGWKRQQQRHVNRCPVANS
jgi:hypothetical protein